MFGLTQGLYFQFFADEYMICEHWFFYNWAVEAVMYKRYGWYKEANTLGVEGV